MSFERANIIPQNFLHSRKLTQFPESTESVEEGNPVCIKRKTTIKWQGEYFYWNYFVGEIYPPHAKCTRTRGRPFWGGYVYKWGLPLKSHECLQKISVLNTKYHLNLCRTLSYKEIIKALHCCEIYNTISTKKKHFTSRQEVVYKEIVLWTQVNKLFLECCYRPVGGSL